MNALKETVAVIGGAIMLARVGRDRFYRAAQERRGLVGRIASAFFQGHAGRVCQNYGLFLENRGRTRITDIALKFYSDDSLHGYGDLKFTRHDGKSLLA